MGTAGKRLVQATLAAAGAIALIATAAPAANAATARNGVCEKGEFCLYYGYHFTGSVSDFNGSIPNYGSTQPGCYEFKGPGAGQGLCVKNNARSARNLTSNWVVKVFYNSNYGGSNHTYNPGGEGDLGSIATENASHLYELVS
ncbi:peptidase inhibitor family I36 protein [Amycolatopsis kentuckyensis]|uniref:peptidase inhibitor family I36 protein n=1 Tax=Amycolatopsis kentuckyensis TaxID=218823 RepID=UPI000A3C8288|nr:peptidase inhibitor family I36 protein [Amycolatopsis kentuckyensis]